MAVESACSSTSPGPLKAPRNRSQVQRKHMGVVRSCLQSQGLTVPFFLRSKKSANLLAYLDLFPSHPGSSCSQRASFRLHCGFGSKHSVGKTGNTDVSSPAFSLGKSRLEATHSWVFTGKQVTLGPQSLLLLPDAQPARKVTGGESSHLTWQ